MNKTTDILSSDKETIAFKKAMLDELSLIFDLFNLKPQDIADIFNVSRTQVDKY